VERYRAGATVYDLAAQFGIGRDTVARRVKAEGVRLRRTSLTADELARATKLYESGLSTIKVGEKLGRHDTTIWMSLRRAGVQMRDAHDRRTPQAFTTEDG
jgi:hypothetical protein